jgi:hypothetical protein
MDKRSNTITLQKTLKEGLRRCVYRRWVVEVKGTVLITKTTDLERMYRGNTPYPMSRPKVSRQTYASAALAKTALQRARARRQADGYRSA